MKKTPTENEIIRSIVDEMVEKGYLISGYDKEGEETIRLTELGKTAKFDNSLYDTVRDACGLLQNTLKYRKIEGSC